LDFLSLDNTVLSGTKQNMEQWPVNKTRAFILRKVVTGTTVSFIPAAPEETKPETAEVEEPAVPESREKEVVAQE